MTNSDRGLEGAFFGWDLLTPTVWIWSFKKKAPLCLHDPVFFDKQHPFRDLHILVNCQLTAAGVQHMHNTDSTNLVPTCSDQISSSQAEASNEEEDDVHTFSMPQSPTQPSHMPLLKPVPPSPPPQAALPSQSASTDSVRPLTRSQKS
eukprot:3719948-Rhodomonas_salina.2